MIENQFTKNEARVLQAADAADGSFVYEVASAAQLTPADVMDAAERLDSRGYLVFDRDKKFVTITSGGKRVQQDISRSSLDDSNLKVGQSYVIQNDEAAEESSLDEMSESDVSAAIDSEISKYE